MSDTWSTWHCEKCQIVLPWKDGMEDLKCAGCEMKAEVLYLRRRCRILDKVLENLGVDWAAEVDKVMKANPKLAEWPTLPGNE